MFNKTLNSTELIYFINNDSIELEFRLNNSSLNSSLQLSAKLNQFKWFLWALFILIIFFTAFGNLLVIIAVYRERKLQTSTNFFLISLAIADFMVALFVMPTSLLVDILNYYPFNSTFCVLWIVLDVLCCTSSIYHMSAMAVDRFLKIKFPFKFGIDKSKRNTLLKIICVWLMSICICLPLLLLGFWDKTNVFDSATRTCMLFNKSFRIYGSLLAFYIPFFIMLVAYASTIHILKQAVNKKLDENKSHAKMMRKGAMRKFPVHKSESNEAKHHQCHINEDFVNLIKSKKQTEIEIINGKRVLYVKPVDLVQHNKNAQKHLHNDSYIDALNSPTSPNIVELDEIGESLIKSKKKFKSKFSFSSHTQSQHQNQDIPSLQSIKSVANNERKALKVLLIIFVIFVTLWCPFFTFNTLSAICESCIRDLLGRYETLFFSIINWLGYFSSMLNPLVYTMFNKSFRTAFKNILRMNKKSSSSVANFISYGAK